MLALLLLSRCSVSSSFSREASKFSSNIFPTIGITVSSLEWSCHGITDLNLFSLNGEVEVQKKRAGIGEVNADEAEN